MALLSFLGVWGTVFGMALMSVLTVLGTYMYSSFIQSTAEKVKHVTVSPPRHYDSAAAAHTAVHDHATLGDLEPADAQGTGPAAPDEIDPVGSGREDAPGRLRTAWRAMVERFGRRRIVLSVVAAFVIFAGTVTVIELTAGRPLADIVRNEDGSGTSLFSGRTGEPADTVDPDSPRERDGGTDQQDAPRERDGDLDQRDQQLPPAEPEQDDPQDQQAPVEEPEQDDEPEQDVPEDQQPPAEEPEQEDPEGVPAQEPGEQGRQAARPEPATPPEPISPPAAPQP